MAAFYEVLFYDGEASQPAYYLLDGIDGEEGKTADDTLRDNIEELTELARKVLHLGEDYPVKRIRDSLYLLRDNGLARASGL